MELKALQRHCGVTFQWCHGMALSLCREHMYVVVLELQYICPHFIIVCCTTQ